MYDVALSRTSQFELTPLNWTLFRRFLVQFEGQFLLLSPLLFEFSRVWWRVGDRLLDEVAEV
jgi:hypothetical protein